MSKQIHLYFIISSLIIAAMVLPTIVNGQLKHIDKEQYKATIQKKYKLDPSIPLTGRITETSPEILQKFRDAGMSPTFHNLSKTDSLKVVRAFKSLPPLHQQILKDHLIGISFLDNMPNTALTATVNPEDPFPVFTITFRAEILKQDVSQWLTEKEMSYFTRDNTNYRLAIEAGNMDAILYVLLHEATHVVDGSISALADNNNRVASKIAVGLKSFTQGIWKDRTQLYHSLVDTLTKQSRFRNGSKLIPMALAQQIYKSAVLKPFVSLYSTSSWHEDLAEYLTVSHFTKKLKQPYRITIYEQNKKIFTYEPMKSPSVTSRMALMKYFYKRKYRVES